MNINFELTPNLDGTDFTDSQSPWYEAIRWDCKLGTKPPITAKGKTAEESLDNALKAYHHSIS